MAHVRKLAKQARRFEQRTKGMSNEETQSLKDLVAMYKKPEDNCVNNFESEDVQTPTKRLRKVGTKDLNCDALCDDMGQWPCTNKGGQWFRRKALK